VSLDDHPRSSNAQKLRFPLAVPGLEYEPRTVGFGDERPDWQRAVDPLGRFRALIGGDVALAKSNAILACAETVAAHPAWEAVAAESGAPS
jgi:glutathione S-transferase